MAWIFALRLMYSGPIHPPQLAVAEAGRMHDSAWCRPARRVFDHPQHVAVVVGRKGLVPRAEIDDLPGPAGPRAAAAEHLAATEAADQERALGFGDVEEFTIHLLARDDEVIVDSRDDGMPGPSDPEDFAL